MSEPRLYTVVAVVAGERWTFYAAATSGPDAEARVREFLGEGGARVQVTALPASGAVMLMQTEDAAIAAARLGGGLGG